MIHNSIILSNEVVVNRSSRRNIAMKIEALRQEVQAQENKIKQLEEALDSLLKLQQR